MGIVSALQRVWGKAIQTDAKISPVNYGGPLIDIQGRVLGILELRRCEQPLHHQRFRERREPDAEPHGRVPVNVRL